MFSRMDRSVSGASTHNCPARQRLRARIHRQYATTTQQIQMGSLGISFTRIADPDGVLDDVAEKADLRQRLTGRRAPDEHLHLPYWAELWDSAIGIGTFLLRGRHCLNSRSVLDLGCGMGLAGTAAAASGARVLFADVEPPALLFAQLNSLPWKDRVRTRRLNWQTDRLAERFDFILGADILYERSQWEYLERFWKQHLAHDGTLVLGEPGRQTGDLFIDWITARHWQLEQFEQPVATRAAPIRIFILRAPLEPM